LGETIVSKLCNISEANALIDAGKRLHVAGDESVLAELHRGTWIGGTIPYFLTREGGVTDRNRVFVTEMPESVTGVEIALVGEDELARLPGEAPANGFSLVILPAMTGVHASYALNAEKLPKLYQNPIIGWVSGVHLSEIGTVKPKVVDGKTGEVSSDRLAVLHASLPDSQVASIGIVNVFEQGSGNTIVFDQAGFSGSACLINGTKANFFDYAKETKLDLKLPLVGDRSGELINVSFQALDEASRSVKFYAPVLEDLEYRQAAPIGDYRAAFAERVNSLHISPAFSCNCILNYLYGNLEGEQDIPIGGPATFGEIAYVLLNQTMVYLIVQD
jgi:hypothetical protein